jgi:hypothetical protein
MQILKRTHKELRIGVNAYHEIQKQRRLSIQSSFPFAEEKKHSGLSIAEARSFFSFLTGFPTNRVGG